MACTAGKYCAKPNSFEINLAKGPTCGTQMSYVYFTTFVFLSSFLVIIILSIFSHLPVEVCTCCIKVGQNCLFFR